MLHRPFRHGGHALHGHGYAGLRGYALFVAGVGVGESADGENEVHAALTENPPRVSGRADEFRRGAFGSEGAFGRGPQHSR